MIKTPYLLILLYACLWPLQLWAETLYLWTDENEKMHITREAPAGDVQIIDIMPYDPQPPQDTPADQMQTEGKAQDSQSGAKCRIAAEALWIARDTREVARAAESRAGRLRKQLRDLKERVGYDDELLDDYKDEIRELESAVRQAELFAEQAEIQSREADLRARQAKGAAGPNCRF